VRGLINIVVGSVGTILMWALVVGAFWLFAAALLYVAGRILPLKRRERSTRRP
jgi:hypothetical protein